MPARQLPVVVEAISGAIVALLGASIVVGGATESVTLLRWSGQLPAAVPIIGLALVLCGLGLLTPNRLAQRAVAGAAAVLMVTVGFSRALGWRHPSEGWLVGPQLPGDASAGLPPSPMTIICVSVIAIALVLCRRLPRTAQGLVVVPLLAGILALLGFLYGDRTSTIRLSAYPNVWTAAPTAAALVAAATGVLARTAGIGVSALLVGDSPGRRTLRGLFPLALVGQVIAAGIALRAGLADRLGQARAMAVLMLAMSAGTSLIALAATRRVDRLAARAARSEVLIAQLAAAERGLRVAELAHALSGVVTSGDVLGEVDAHAAVVVGAQRSNVLELGEGLAATRAYPAASDALRADRLVTIGSVEEYRARYPAAEGTAECLGGALAAVPVKVREGSPLEVLLLAWAEPSTFDDAMTSTLQTMGEMVSQSLERARLLDDLALDARRSAELARLAEAMAGAVTVDDVMQFVAERITAPVGAMGAAIGIIDANKQVFRRYFGGELDVELARVYATESLDSTMPLIESSRTGATILFPDRAAVAATHPQALDAFDAAGYRAFATMPLRGRNGDPFGGLMVGWNRPVQFDESIVTLLSTIADLVSQTLERTWLGEARARDAERSELLASLARRVIAVANIAEVAAVVADHLPPVLGARSASLDLLDDDGARGRVAALGTIPTTLLEVAPGPSEAPGASSARVTSRLAMPLVSGETEVLGIVNAEWAEPVDFEGPLRSTLATVAELLTVTVQRVQLGEAEHRLIADLQRRALIPAPPTPGLRVAAQYYPARSELGMGGDWFQGLALEGGRLGLIVGDVVGHGAVAAGDMTQLSGIVATLLRVGTPLEELLAVVHEAVGPLGIMATVVVCEIDPVARVVRHVSAGHPPLLITDAEGTSTWLTEGRGPLVGLASEGGAVGVSPLPVGSTLVAYTDGLVERRGEHFDVGLGRLRDAMVSTADLDMEAQLDAVVRRCTAEHEVEDDIAVVAVRAVPT